MLEFLLCSLVTIVPDYLLRRFAQGKRWGQEITFYTMWYELRWGISACLLLTVALITLIFYYHPSTSNASPFFRAVPVLPEEGGRVAEVFVRNNQAVEAGDPLFSLHDSTQFASVEVARQRVKEVEAAFETARSELAATRGLVDQAMGSLQKAITELKRKKDLRAVNPELLAAAEIDRLESQVDSLEGALAAAQAGRDTAAAQLEAVLPSQLASVQKELERTMAELDKTVVHASINGQMQQFLLEPGDYVNPILRPAGIIVPTDNLESGRFRVQAGFNQLAGQVIRPGTLAEISCLSRPFKVIPMVVVDVQSVIAAGQVRPTDLLIDIQDRGRPGSLAVVMEPLYAGGLEGVYPGSKCIANAYSNHHELLASGELGFGASAYLHMVDTVGVVHALILRIQALMLPVRLLVFAGH